MFEENLIKNPRHINLESTEQLEVSSGKIIVVDQFMLANSQFINPLQRFAAGGLEENYKEISQHIKKYGSAVLEVPVGIYPVLRLVEQETILILDSKFKTKLDDLLEEAYQEEDHTLRLKEENCNLNVYIDTRCLVFSDLEILRDRQLIEKYQKMRRFGEDKPARDLLRENGCAVRYGFDAVRDNLEVCWFSEINSYGFRTRKL